jgi:DNA-binding CsgD family transcriptional regulator
MPEYEALEEANRRAEALVASAVEAMGSQFDVLTARERDIALRLAIGDRNRDIALSLGISVKTVDTHRSHLLRKLHCRHNVDLARLAIRAGLLSA